jgi:hypothetical protein
LGRHAEVEQGDQWLLDGGQEGLFLKSFKAVTAYIFTDDSAVFLFGSAFMPQTVVIFLVVAAFGKGDACIFTPAFCGVVDKFRAVIAVELINWEDDGGFDES